jgi:hypothetical protein
MDVWGEVESWLASLPAHTFGQAAFSVDLLADKGPQLGETVHQATGWQAA